MASGLVLPLAFAPFYLGWLAPLSLAMLYLCWQDVSPRVAAGRGMLYGSGAFLTGTYWLYISIHVFGNAPILLALFLMLCLVLIKGAYHALLGYVLVRFCRQRTAWFWLTLPAGWLLLEWLRGWLFGGFPWLSLGYSQTDTWLAGYAPVAGVYGVSLVIAFVAGMIAIILSTNWGAGDANGRKHGLIAVSALFLVLLAGAWLSSLQWTQPDDTTVRAALIQGAISQDKKWLKEQREPTMELYLGLSREHWDADLIVWPEAAVPGLAHSFGDYLSAVQIEAQQNDTDILLGILSIDRQDGRFSNTALALTDTRAFYFKRHLVPFGEYFPVPALIREWMRLRNLPYVDFDAGDPDQPPLTLAGQPVALSICYEDAFGAEQLRPVKLITLSDPQPTVPRFARADIQQTFAVRRQRHPRPNQTSDEFFPRWERQAVQNERTRRLRPEERPSQRHGQDERQCTKGDRQSPPRACAPCRTRSSLIPISEMLTPQSLHEILC